MMADKIRGITVEIGGDTSGLDKALKKTNSEINGTQKELKQVERLLKLDPTNTDLLAQRQELLSKAVGQTTDKLDALKKAKAQADEEMKNGTEVNQQQYRLLVREIADTEQKQAALTAELENFGKMADKELPKASEKIASVGSAMEKAGEKIAGVGKTLTATVTAPLAAAGGYGLKAASDFEDAIAKLSTIADASVPIDELEKSIIELSDASGIAATEIAGNVYDAISAGQSTGDAVSFVENATRLARAGFTSSAASLDILTTALNAYGLESSEVGRVSDVLITTQNLGKTTVDQLAAAMGKAIPTAKANGVSIENLASMYAVMTANGIATAETTTYLNSMLNELGKTDSKAAEAFAKGTEHIKKGGLTMKEAMEEGWELTDVLSILDEQAAESGTSISNMFGSAEAGKAASVLLDNAEKLNDVVDQMGSSAGATDAAFEKLNTTSYQAQIAINEIKNTAVDFGGTLLEMLMPYIDALTEKIKAVTEWLKGLDDEQKETVIQIGAVVAAIGPVLVVIGKLSEGIGKVMQWAPKLSAFASKVMSFIGPVGALPIAIIALVTAIAIFGDDIQRILQKVDDFLQGVFAKDWTEQFGILGNVLNGFFEGVKSIWDAIKLIFDGIIDFIRGVFTGDWERAWNGVKEIFGGAFQGLVALAKAPLNIILGLINGVIEGVNKMIRGLNKISIDIPDWVPVFGGESFGLHLPEIGKIPLLANGGVVSNGGRAIVGEAGAEMLTVQGGRAYVQPIGGGAPQIVMNNTFNGYDSAAGAAAARDLVAQINRELGRVY